MELGPFWGGDLGASWSTKHSFPIGDRQLPETPVSASPRLVKSAFLVPGASVPLSKQRFPLPLCPFPSPFPFSSPAVSHFSVCPLVSLSCPSKRVGIRQRQHHSSHPVICPSGWQHLTFTGDKQWCDRHASGGPCRLWSSRHSQTGDI